LYATCTATHLDRCTGNVGFHHDNIWQLQPVWVFLGSDKTSIMLQTPSLYLNWWEKSAQCAE
jgi:hypothetical protein